MSAREKFLRKIYERKLLYRSLGVFSHFVSLLCVLAYGTLLLLNLKDGRYLEILKLLIAAGIPFFAVGAARSIIKAPRPYEVFDFYESTPRKKAFSDIRASEGSDSFPSRHAYSAFVIATLVFFACPSAGGVLWGLAALMCAARVLLGIHFIKDVLCGAAIGVCAGVLGELLLRF